MTTVDQLVKIDLIRLLEQALTALRERNPQLWSMASAMFAGRQSRLGLEITADGKPVGQYTLHLDGMKTSHAEVGKLDPQIRHPLLGTIRIYVSMERAMLEWALTDQALRRDPLPAIGAYLPEITIRFLP